MPATSTMTTAGECPEGLGRDVFGRATIYGSACGAIGWVSNYLFAGFYRGANRAAPRQPDRKREAELHLSRGPSYAPGEGGLSGGAVGRQVIQSSDAATIRGLLSVPSNSRHAVADVSYAVQATDTYVAYTSLTAPRTVTLPAASAYPVGQPLWVADETGACSTDDPIIVAAAGSDTIAGQPNITLASPYQKAALHSNGTNLWVL